MNLLLALLLSFLGCLLPPQCRSFALSLLEQRCLLTHLPAFGLEFFLALPLEELGFLPPLLPQLLFARNEKLPVSLPFFLIVGDLLQLPLELLVLVVLGLLLL